MGWQGRKVLIVDDMDSARNMLSQRYVSMGLDVCGLAVNGVDALNKIEEFHPDLVSLDIIMPEMDGIECYREIRKKHGELPCVFISYLASEDKVIAAYSNEISPELFLTKSFTEGQLAKCLEFIFGADDAYKPVEPQKGSNIAQLTAKKDNTSDVEPEIDL